MLSSKPAAGSRRGGSSGLGTGRGCAVILTENDSNNSRIIEESLHHDSQSQSATDRHCRAAVPPRGWVNPSAARRRGAARPPPRRAAPKGGGGIFSTTTQPPRSLHAATMLSTKDRQTVWRRTWLGEAPAPESSTGSSGRRARPCRGTMWAHLISTVTIGRAHTCCLAPHSV